MFCVMNVGHFLLMKIKRHSNNNNKKCSPLNKHLLVGWLVDVFLLMKMSPPNGIRGIQELDLHNNNDNRG